MTFGNSSALNYYEEIERQRRVEEYVRQIQNSQQSYNPWQGLGYDQDPQGNFPTPQTKNQHNKKLLLVEENI